MLVQRAALRSGSSTRRQIRLARPWAVNSWLEKSRWKVPLSSGTRTGSNSARGEMRIAAFGQGEASAEKQDAAAAAIGEFANQVLLGLGEIVGLHAADDQTIESEQLFGLGRKSFFQLMRIVEALAVNLVLGGAQHGSKLQAAIVFARRGG